VTGEAFRRALYFDQMERSIAIGLTRSGEALQANLESSTAPGAPMSRSVTAYVNHAQIAPLLILFVFTLWPRAPKDESGESAHESDQNRLGAHGHHKVRALPIWNKFENPGRQDAG